MTTDIALHDGLARSVARDGKRTAVEEADGTAITYAALDRLSDRLRDRLQVLGVQPGDRVGIWCRKSIDAVASIFGILKAGAAYVPVDPSAPAARNGGILASCSAAAVIVEERYAAGLQAELDRARHATRTLVLGAPGGGRALEACLDALDAAAPAPTGRTERPGADALAYILFTSGSTGKPKGVMLSHRNATSFVDWCSRVFAPTADDRFSAHAPFHFDLSILDLFVSLQHGATLVVIGEELGKEPAGLAELIARSRITIWYSAPSILNLLAQSGQLTGRDTSALRLVLFAGEVFPIVQLRALVAQWPEPRYWNLYGPTETNVCTAYEVPLASLAARTEPCPIGTVCDQLEGLVVDPDGQPLDAAAEGELCIAGPNVMQGYWGDSAQTEQRFLSVRSRRFYRTGDIVLRDENGDYKYVGRRDRMVKKRGYRVELGEIETCLSAHPDVKEVAVVALPHPEHGLLVKAHLGTADGQRLGLIKLKAFCAERLPVYMVPDQFEFHAVLPKTSTGKLDYQTLAARG